MGTIALAAPGIVARVFPAPASLTRRCALVRRDSKNVALNKRQT
jgi:hypothetical protein